MSYFVENYPSFKYPLKEDDTPGFRPAQIGAIHSAAAHFATRNDPGIVTMPTGSGKTAVLIAAAFVLRAQRVLIIAPSRLVREQIAEEVETLATLRAAGAIGPEVLAPRVFNTKKRIATADAWEALREYDVVVGTVKCICPEYTAIPEPPRDLFDLVLADEAHHSPARTWRAVLDHFQEAQRLLFTATPFRQDQREIKGRFIFTYDLRKAFEDKIFGEIKYHAVTPNPRQSHDVAIAKAADTQYAAAEAERPPDPDPERLASLGRDLSKLWEAEETAARDRKRLLSCLLDDVILRMDRDAWKISVFLQWKGGRTDEFHMPVLTGRREIKRDDADTVDLLHRLAAFYPDGEIARILNRQKRVTTRGLQYTGSRVAALRGRHGIPVCPPREADASGAPAELVASGDGLDARSIQASFGYGFGVFGDRVTMTPEFDLGLSDTGRDYRLGWRLSRGSRAGETGPLELLLETTRREFANDNGAGTEPEHTVGFKIEASF